MASSANALERTRTAMPYGTTPSRWRVSQFHHQGKPLLEPRGSIPRAARITLKNKTGPTGLEPATSRVTVECSNQAELRWRKKLTARIPCPGADSNRYAFRHHPLKMACLPISPPGQLFIKTTGPTGLEPATSRVTVECSNQTELRPLIQTRTLTARHHHNHSPKGNRTPLCTVKGCRPNR